MVNAGGFRRAAESLHVTQPAISARIHALETSLGVSLFERGQGVVLSAAGRALKPHADQLLQLVTRARQAVHDLQSTSAGTIRIAAALSICTYLLPDVLKRYHAEHPGVAIAVRSGHSKQVLDMVVRDEAEIGLARSLHHPEVETLSLRDDPLVLVVERSTWRARNRRVRLEEVSDRPLILFDKGSSDWTLTNNLFRAAGLVANVVMEVEAIETAKRMVERGMGLAFLPRLAVAPEIRDGTLLALEVTDAKPLSRSLDVIHARQRPLSPDALAFLTVVRAAVSDVGTSRATMRPRGRPSRRRRAAARSPQGDSRETS